MFNKKESMPFKPNTNPTINLINSGTIITGEINSNGDIRIDGQLNGTINTKGKVVIGKKGKIEGVINCSNADISGEVNAKTTVSQLLLLKSTARLCGDIIINKLAIEPGANFTGKCSMGESVVKDIKDAEKTQPQEKQEKTA